MCIWQQASRETVRVMWCWGRALQKQQQSWLCVSVDLVRDVCTQSEFTSWVSKATMTEEAGGIGKPISCPPPFCLAKGMITP